MRLVFAAALALLMAAPALAGSASTINVGLTVTGSFASPLVGIWHSRTAARRGIYQLVVNRSSGAFFELVSVGTCALRISGIIHSLEPSSGQKRSYEMTYSIQSADAVTSSNDSDDCQDAAASYLNDMAAADSTRSLILSTAGEGRLIDSATRTEYIRTR